MAFYTFYYIGRTVQKKKKKVYETHPRFVGRYHNGVYMCVCVLL